MWTLALLVAITPVQDPPPSAPVQASSRQPELDTNEQFITDNASAAEARRHLRRLTEDPHVAGTPEDRASAEYVRAELERFGFETEIAEYHAFLPYPKRIELALTAPNEVEFDLREQPDPRDKDSLDIPIATYNAYSASDTVEAPVVYAHLGRAEDFEWLDAKGVSVAGKICLIRYGGQFRGLKVRDAARRGAVGVLLYSDPDDDGYRRGDPHPDGPWRPPTAVQRGSILYLSQMCGDPLTPGWPALEGAKRMDPADCEWLPKIPCIPISWANAHQILKEMRGPVVQRKWQGGCPTTYHLGPGPARVRMTVELDDGIRPLWNVIGRLRTPKTSQRYVLVGGHRDSWVHGAIDPSSGTALALESMRVLGELVQGGWEPRYEIRFASWDAEEFGLVGSTEWCEHHADEIQRNCLAYFNCDSAISGDRFGASATPDLVEFLGEVAARTVPHDRKGRLLTRWAHGGSRPPCSNLGSGSDYTAFVCHLGIPAFDFGSRGGHGVYHSLYDNMYTMETFIDPDFEIHASMARFLGIAAYRFANAERPPLDSIAWGAWLDSAVASIDGLSELHSTRLSDAILVLRESAGATQSEEQHVALHRALLDAEGIPGRAWFRNLLVAPGIDLGYGAATLPELREALEREDEVAVTRAVDKLVSVFEAMTLVLRSE